MVDPSGPASITQRLPGEPKLEGVGAAAALDGLVAEVVLSMEFVRLRLGQRILLSVTGQGQSGEVDRIGWGHKLFTESQLCSWG